MVLLKATGNLRAMAGTSRSARRKRSATRVEASPTAFALQPPSRGPQRLPTSPGPVGGLTGSLWHVAGGPPPTMSRGPLAGDLSFDIVSLWMPLKRQDKN
jgi:hypothetical protein